MSTEYKDNSFWGPFGPLSSLAGIAIVIGASSRLSDALILVPGIFFVYVGTLVLIHAAQSVVPARLFQLCGVLSASFLAFAYGTLVSLFLPVSGVAFYLALVPVAFIGQDLIARSAASDLEDAVVLSFRDASFFTLLLLAFALIREPLGLGTLTLPSSLGPVNIFTAPFLDPYTCKWIASSSGGLILLGYAVALFRLVRARSRKEKTGDAQ